MPPRPRAAGPALHSERWRKKTGFDNIMTEEELIDAMPPFERYPFMNRLEKKGYYDRKERDHA